MLTDRDKEIRLKLQDFISQFVFEVSDHMIYCHPVSSSDEALSLQMALAKQGRTCLPVSYCSLESVQQIIKSK